MENDRYKSFIENVGKNVRKKRKEKGISMEKLALEAEMEYRQLGRIERGESNTTLTTLCRIADALGTEPYLFLKPSPKEETSSS